jgi:hypothetical protein
VASRNRAAGTAADGALDAALAGLTAVAGEERPAWWLAAIVGWRAGRLGFSTAEGAIMDRPVYEIDGRDFSTLDEFYAVFDRVLVPGTSWGHNLDAFNDVLRGGFGTPEGGFVLRWANAAESRIRLGYPETVRQLRLRLARCHPSNRAAVAGDLARAEAGTGPTVFDWLVEMIRDHGPGGREPGDGVELVLA